MPENKISLNKDQVDKILTLVEKLEDFDDVQEVVHNLEDCDEFD